MGLQFDRKGYIPLANFFFGAADSLASKRPRMQLRAACCGEAVRVLWWRVKRLPIGLVSIYRAGDETLAEGAKDSRQSCHAALSRFKEGIIRLDESSVDFGRVSKSLREIPIAPVARPTGERLLKLDSAD
jgi:hypothetical protein